MNALWRVTQPLLNLLSTQTVDFDPVPVVQDPDEMGDSLSLQVYSVPEIRNTVKAFNRTAHSAAKLGLTKVAPWICLGCGFRRDVLYPGGGSVLYDTVWDYDVSYSYLLGAMMHEKLPYGGPKRPEQFGDWGFAKFGVFYPSIIDTEAQDCRSGVNALSPCTVYTLTESREVRLRHFTAYVRGAALWTGNLSQGGEFNNALSIFLPAQPVSVCFVLD